MGEKKRLTAAAWSATTTTTADKLMMMMMTAAAAAAAAAHSWGGRQKRIHHGVNVVILSAKRIFRKHFVLICVVFVLPKLAVMVIERQLIPVAVVEEQTFSHSRLLYASNNVCERMEQPGDAVRVDLAHRKHVAKRPEHPAARPRLGVVMCALDLPRNCAA